MGVIDIMSDAFDYFRAYPVRALCKARSMPRGRMRHLQLLAGRIYNLLKKEASYSPIHGTFTPLEPVRKGVSSPTSVVWPLEEVSS